VVFSPQFNFPTSLPMNLNAPQRVQNVCELAVRVRLQNKQQVDWKGLGQMPLMLWNDKVSVGVETLDEDHHKIFAMINELYDAIDKGSSGAMIGDLLERLKRYFKCHCAHEEAFFVMTSYPDAAAHKREHDEMIVWVTDMQDRYQSGTVVAPSLEVMVRLEDWLFDHVIRCDQKYTAHLNAMGIH
jgi:hemerythrin